MAEVSPITLGALLRHVRSALLTAGIGEASLDARLIVEQATGTGRLDAIANPQRLIPTKQVDAALAALARRLAGEPVHRILGFREFYGLRLELSAATLEPRPDTETLVDLVLPAVRAAADAHGECRVLDLGTGTGAIALALLAQEPRAEAVGVDISADALAIARRNADINGLGARFTGITSDWFSQVAGRFHIVVSNPPYIRSEEIETLSPDVRLHDPLPALDGGKDGLDAYRLIATGAAAYMNPGAAIAVEVGYDQADAVTALFTAEKLMAFGSGKDLGGHVRALAFRRA